MTGRWGFAPVLLRYPNSLCIALLNSSLSRDAGSGPGENMGNERRKEGRAESVAWWLLLELVSPRPRGGAAAAAAF